MEKQDEINKELVRWRFALLVFFFLTIVTIDSIGQNYGLNLRHGKRILTIEQSLT
jgi:hypothetical protein